MERQQSARKEPPSLRIKKGASELKKMHKNTKYWSFTWGTTVTQKRLPDEIKLKKFLNTITENCVFQLESGTVKNKEHYQGAFTLVGPRVSKKKLLEGFQENFNNVSGLTLTKTYDSKAAMKYGSKAETRLKGPFYVGQEENYSEEYASMSLRQWQRELFEFIVKNKDNPIVRERKIIWVEDGKGCTGKSKFQKWLRLGQRDIIARKLPVSTVERLISAVTKLTRQEDVDLLMINLTKSRGQDQSMSDMFATIEDIKDGYIVDTLYGKYVEAIFNPPIILIFTNEKLDDHLASLSPDRWLRLHINSDYSIEFRNLCEDGTVTSISLPKLNIKK